MLSRETILEENGDSDGEGSEAGNNFKVMSPSTFLAKVNAETNCFVILDPYEYQIHLHVSLG